MQSFKLKHALLGMTMVAGSVHAADAYQMQHSLALGGGTSGAVVAAPGNLSSISCGQKHCYGLLNGEVWAVGDNTYSQLGLGDTNPRNTWTATGFTADSVEAGYLSGYAIKDGNVHVIGRNYFGNLGLGDTVDRSVWTDTGLAATAVFSGGHHAHAIVGGEVYSTGWNGDGQLGIGSIGSSFFSWMPTGFQADHIEVGEATSYALKDGKLYVTGEGFYGQLGIGLSGPAGHVGSFTYSMDVDDVKAGFRHAVVLSGGQVYTAGYANNGQLGLGTIPHRASWTGTGLTGATAIGASSHSSYAIVGGTVFSTGSDVSGQLGSPGGATNLFTDTTFTASELTSTLGAFMLAKSGSSLYAVGQNTDGQLGLGDTANRDAFTEVTGTTP